MRNEFTAIVEQDDGWFIAYSPEVPGANGQGRTKQEAMKSLSEAIALVLEDRKQKINKSSFGCYGEGFMHNNRIIIERHEDGYVAYPLGFTRGAIVSEGDTYSDALKDTESAIEFFIEHYGKEEFLKHF